MAEGKISFNSRIRELASGDIYLPDGDYFAPDGLWLTIESSSIRIWPDGTGINIAVFRSGRETEDPLFTFHIPFGDLEHENSNDEDSTDQGA